MDTEMQGRQPPAPSLLFSPHDGEALELRHVPWLDKTLDRLSGEFSEYSAANLYLFRHVHAYRFVGHDRMFLDGRTYDGHRYLMPLFDVAEADFSFLTGALNGHDFFFPINEATLFRMDRSRFRWDQNDDDSDYLYEGESLVHFRGRPIHSKRNQLKLFLRHYSATTYPLTSLRQDDALSILYRWQDDTGKHPDETDFRPCAEALQHLDALGLFGFIHYAETQPCGFILGRMLRPGTCCIHFAKGCKEITGIFPFLFWHFANHFDGQFSWYNFEQDMGIAGFRRAKRSYAPAALLRKYRVTPLF